MRQLGMAIEQIVLWIMRQTEAPNRHLPDTSRAVEWSIASRELGFPKPTDGKRMLQEWRARVTARHSTPKRTGR